MFEPLVSILIPVYNGSNYLAEAIDSALAQSYPKKEIIVVNDGSDDNGASEKIALSYGDSIRYYSKSNGGVSSALNLALTKMHGEWFSWLSHDDLLMPEKIQKQVDFLRKLKEKDPQINLEKVVLHSATLSINSAGGVIKRPSYRTVPVEERKPDVILDNVFNYRLAGCSFLLPAACVENIGKFREDIRTVSDVEFWYRLIFSGYAFFCLKHDRLVKNRSHKRQVGKTRVSLFNTELNELHKRVADELVSDGYSFKELRKLYFGLEKRRLNDASQYVLNTYLKPKASSWTKKVELPLGKMYWTAIGGIRFVARDLFRMIHVR